MSANADNSQQLIDAGISMLITQPQQLLLRGLNVEQTFQESDVSRATFYRRFPTKEGFLSNVVDALIRSIRFVDTDGLTAVQRAKVDGGEDLPQTIRTLIENGWSSAISSGYPVRHLLAALFGRSTPNTRVELRSSHEVRDLATTALLDELIGSTGATLRKPFTAQSLSTALTAIVDGFLLRDVADQRSSTPALLSDVVLAFLNAVLTPVHDHGHLYGTLDALVPVRDETEAPRDPRAALIAAARDEFARSGYFGASYERIASTARVPVQTARRLFPTKTHVIAGALKPHYERLQSAIDDDLLIELDEVDVVKNHFIRCAHLASDEYAFMDSLVAAVAHDTYSEPDGMIAIKQSLNFPGLIVPTIMQGQRKGRFNPDYAAFELAAMMTNTLLLRCFTRRDHTPEVNAGIVSDLLLDGKCTPSNP